MIKIKKENIKYIIKYVLTVFFIIVVLCKIAQLPMFASKEEVEEGIFLSSNIATIIAFATIFSISSFLEKKEVYGFTYYEIYYKYFSILEMFIMMLTAVIGSIIIYWLGLNKIYLLILLIFNIILLSYFFVTIIKFSISGIDREKELNIEVINIIEKKIKKYIKGIDFKNLNISSSNKEDLEYVKRRLKRYYQYGKFSEFDIELIKLIEKECLSIMKKMKKNQVKENCLLHKMYIEMSEEFSNKNPRIFNEYNLDSSKGWIIGCNQGFYIKSLEIKKYMITDSFSHVLEDIFCWFKKPENNGTPKADEEFLNAKKRIFNHINSVCLCESLTVHEKKEFLSNFFSNVKSVFMKDKLVDNEFFDESKKTIVLYRFIILCVLNSFKLQRETVKFTGSFRGDIYKISKCLLEKFSDFREEIEKIIIFNIIVLIEFDEKFNFLEIRDMVNLLSGVVKDIDYYNISKYKDEIKGISEQKNKLGDITLDEKVSHSIQQELLNKFSLVKNYSKSIEVHEKIDRLKCAL